MVSATEELLRYDSPVQKLGRLAIEDIEVDGKKIAKGDQIIFCYAAANRDPEEFQSSNQLDLSRTNNRHMAFAHGTHYCLGAAPARLEGQISINAVVQRMPNLKLDSDGLEWNPSAILRGLKSLPVSFQVDKSHAAPARRPGLDRGPGSAGAETLPPSLSSMLRIQ